MHMWHMWHCSCLSALAQLCPLSESKYFEANTSSQIFPGSLCWLYTVPLGQTMLLLFLLGLFSRLTAALCPISKAIPLQGNVQAQPPLAFWFCIISCSLELSFRVVQRPGACWKSLPKVFPGCSVVSTKSLFQAPVAAPEIPQRCSRVDGEVQFQNAQNIPAVHYPWVTDMVITAYQISACLRKGLSHTSTHTSEICRQKTSWYD